MIKLTPAKCPLCGADIEVNPNLEKAMCQYCGSTILVEESVQKIQVEHSGSIKLEGFSKRDKDFEKAKKYIKIKEFDKALELLTEIVKEDPFDIESLSNIIICILGRIKGFNLDINSSKNGADSILFKQLVEYIDKLNKIDVDNERKKYLKDYQNDIDKYIKIINEHNSTKSRRKEMIGKINSDKRSIIPKLKDKYYEILNETMKTGNIKVSNDSFRELTFDGYFVNSNGYLNLNGTSVKSINELEDRFSNYQKLVKDVIDKSNTKKYKHGLNILRIGIIYGVISLILIILCIFVSMIFCTGLIAIIPLSLYFITYGLKEMKKNSI